MKASNLAVFLAGVLAGYGALLVPSAVAQQAPPVHRVGILNPNSPAVAQKYVDAFRSEMRRLGYTDANLMVDVRYADGRADRLEELARELLQSKVDVVLAPSEPALIAVQKVAGTVPIVSVSCDPLEKFVGRLNRPGGNVTGFSCVSAELAGKRLALLKTLVPNLERVALFYSLPNAYEPDLGKVEQAAQTLGISVTRFPVSLPAEFEGAFAGIEKGRHQAVYIQLSAFANFHRRALAQLASKHRVAAIFGFREFPEDGGLMSYGADNSDGYRRGAYFVDRILKGARPGDLPAEEPARFYLVINARTAASLGIAIPSELLIQADEVIR